MQVLPWEMRKLDVQRAVTGGREGGFLDGFGERRVGVDMRLMSSAVASEFHGDDRFGNHIRSTGPAHVDAEDFIGLGSANTLIEPSVSMEHGTAACLERERTGFVGTPSAFNCSSVCPTPATSGHVHHVGNQVVIDVGMCPAMTSAATRLLLFRFVGEHGAAHHVADGVDVTDRGLHLVVHRDASAVIGLQSGGFEVEAFGVGLASHRDEAVIRFPDDFLALLVIGFDRDLFGRGLDFFHAVLQVELDPQLFHAAHQFLAHRAVHGRDDGILVFDYVNLGSESGERSPFPIR